MSEAAVEVNITAGQMLKHRAAMFKVGDVVAYIYLLCQQTEPQGMLGCSKLLDLRPKPQFGSWEFMFCVCC